MKAQRKDKTMNDAVLVTPDDFEAICDTYSADRIADGKPIKAPFEMYGHRYVCVGVMASTRADAYRLTPISEFVTQFNAIPVTYGQKVFPNFDYAGMEDYVGKAAREDPMGFYHGMRVKQGRDEYVITGPGISFQVAE